MTKVGHVHGQVPGDAHGQVPGDVHGQVPGDVHGQVPGDVHGQVPGHVHDQSRLCQWPKGWTSESAIDLINFCTTECIN